MALHLPFPRTPARPDHWPSLMWLKPWVGGLCLAASVGGHGLLLGMPVPSASSSTEEATVEEVPLEIMDVAVLPATPDVSTFPDASALGDELADLPAVVRPPNPRGVVSTPRATPAPVAQTVPSPPVEPPAMDRTVVDMPPPVANEVEVTPEPESTPDPEVVPEPETRLDPEVTLNPEAALEPEVRPEPEVALEPETAEAISLETEPTEDPMPHADFPHAAGAQRVSCDGGGSCWRSPVEGSWRGAARSLTTDLEAQGYQVDDVTGQVLSIDTGVYVYAVQKDGEDPFYLNFVSVSGDVLYSMTTDPISTDIVRQLQAM